MKKIILGISIFVLILFTTLTKNSTKKIDKEIFLIKEDLRLLGDKHELELLEHNYLSSPKKLLEYQKKYFETELIPIETKNSTELHYFISNSQGQIITSGIKDVFDNKTTITLENEEIENLPNGPITLKIFAASDTVLRPYEFSTSFLVVESDSSLPKSVISDNLLNTKDTDYIGFIAIIILIIMGLSIIIVKKRMK